VSLAAVLAAACFDHPIDPAPQIALDPALVGTWRCLPVDGDADDKPATVAVAPQGTREYAVTWKEKQGEEPDRYRAYLSSLPIPRLLNVQLLKEGQKDKTWVFVRYPMLRRGVVHMEYLDDERLKGVENTPVALRRAVERQRKSRELFKDWCVCVLVKAQ
jgi:hypothetical protein